MHHVQPNFYILFYLVANLSHKDMRGGRVEGNLGIWLPNFDIFTHIYQTSKKKMKHDSENCTHCLPPKHHGMITYIKKIFLSESKCSSACLVMLEVDRGVGYICTQ